MPSLRFAQLLNLYRHTAFDATGDEGALSIASAEILEDLQFIESDEQTAADANLALLAEPAALTVGQTVRIRVAAPRLALGLLVRNLDDLLNAPEARISEPQAYYVVEGGLERDLDPVPPVVAAYRKVLDIVALFTQASSYLDRTRQELVFFRDRKIVIPVRFNAKALEMVSIQAADQLLQNFKDDVHKDQKLAILAEALIHIGEPQPVARRFPYLLENLGAALEEVRAGYRLFASSFSYAKIRSDVESARVEYVGKIHKTLIDIQGQLLGIPVATIIVASQLKAVEDCGVEFWTNVAVLGGAWIFLVLLAVAIVNQWVTLSSISADIKAQQGKLMRDYAAINAQFADVFKGLSGRILWHRGALIGIGIIAAAGAVFATVAYKQLTHVSLRACFTPQAQATKAVGHPPAPTAPKDNITSNRSDKLSVDVKSQAPQSAAPGSDNK